MPFGGPVSYLTGHRDTSPDPRAVLEMSCLPVFWGQSRLLLLGLWGEVRRTSQDKAGAEVGVSSGDSEGLDVLRSMRVN